MLIGVLFEEDCVVVQVVQNGRTDAHKTVGRHGRSRDCRSGRIWGAAKSEKEPRKTTDGPWPERQGTGKRDMANLWFSPGGTGSCGIVRQCLDMPCRRRVQENFALQGDLTGRVGRAVLPGNAARRARVDISAVGWKRPGRRTAGASHAPEEVPCPPCFPIPRPCWPWRRPWAPASFPRVCCFSACSAPFFRIWM